MCRKFNIALRKIVVAMTLLSLSLAAQQTGAQESVGAALNKCAGIADDEARLACYDALATVRVDSQNNVGIADDNNAGATGPAAAATAAVVVEAEGPAPLTDKVGKERIEPISDDERPRFAEQDK